MEDIYNTLEKCSDQLNARLLEKGVLYSDEAKETIMSELGMPNRSVLDNTWH